MKCVLPILFGFQGTVRNIAIISTYQSINKLESMNLNSMEA